MEEERKAAELEELKAALDALPPITAENRAKRAQIMKRIMELMKAGK